MDLRKIIFTIFFFIFPNFHLYPSQIILQQIDIVKNYQIVKTYFDYTIGSFYLKDFEKKNILVKNNGSLESTLKTIFDNKKYIESRTVFIDYSATDDKIIMKKFLILDTNYEILDINNDKYYKFTIFVKKSISKKNFFNEIISRFKIEYGLN